MNHHLVVIPRKKKKFMSRMNLWSLKIFRRKRRFLCPLLEIVRPIDKVGLEVKIIIFESIGVNEKFL